MNVAAVAASRFSSRSNYIAGLNDRFGENVLHRRDSISDLVEAQMLTSLHQHQAASSCVDVYGPCLIATI